MKIFTSVFFLAIPSLVIGQQTSHEEHVRRVIAYMRTAILVTILAGLNPLLLAQSHASDANRTRSLHVATFKAKDGALTIDEIAGARKLSLYDDADTSIVEGLRKKRFINGAKRRKYASLLQ